MSKYFPCYYSSHSSNLFTILDVLADQFLLSFDKMFSSGQVLNLNSATGTTIGQHTNSEHSVSPSHNPSIACHRSTKVTRVPVYLVDYHHNLALSLANDQLQSVNEANYAHSIAHPFQKFVSYNSLSPSFRAFSVSLPAHLKPSSFEHAILSESWCKVMNEELDALQINKT